jgi:hypothetical protein
VVVALALVTALGTRSRAVGLAAATS